MIERTTAYKSADGKLFEDARDAELHDAEIALDNAFYADEIIGDYAGSKADLTSLKDWLNDNKNVVLRFLGESIEEAEK